MSYKDLKNEQAIEALADIIEPATEIFSDAEVAESFRAREKMRGIKAILKKHAKAVVEILARLEGVEPDEYECNMLTLPATLGDLFNDPDIAMLFQSQGQKEDETSSGSAMENTKDAEK